MLSGWEEGERCLKNVQKLLDDVLPHCEIVVQEMQTAVINKCIMIQTWEKFTSYSHRVQNICSKLKGSSPTSGDSENWALFHLQHILPLSWVLSKFSQEQGKEVLS